MGRDDGQDITVFHVQENVYATMVRPGSIDQALAYFVHDLGMRLPLAELMNSQLAKSLLERVRVAHYVESSSIAGGLAGNAMVPIEFLRLSATSQVTADPAMWIGR